MKINLLMGAALAPLALALPAVAADVAADVAAAQPADTAPVT